ncbi:hypothetical protein V3C99_018053 [Haemonchus contortus]|uniref:Uncharacterized protein n=1 Tax=Haemonchus contortus TaxID=6289 RepID=A0A7I4Z5Q6_HAECO
MAMESTKCVSHELRSSWAVTFLPAVLPLAIAVLPIHVRRSHAYLWNYSLGSILSYALFEHFLLVCSSSYLSILFLP